MKILTFDLEEWFHILDNNETKTEESWNRYESRINDNTDRILEFLIKKKLSATFFVVGWVAEKYPNLLKKIDSLGFEIASHTYMHQLMYEQNSHQVNEDLKKSIQILEDNIGKKVTAFRAPGFSITEKNKWVFEVLLNNGITHDCSVFPANRAHGGMPKYGLAVPSKVSVNGNSLREFPINTISFFGRKLIFSGGGYFRITPYPIIRNWSKKSDYVMTYFHPRDFDPDQPMIKNLSITRKFKSYVGLKNCLGKLDKWVNDFDFIDLRSADKIIDWDNAPVIRL